MDGGIVWWPEMSRVEQTFIITWQVSGTVTIQHDVCIIGGGCVGLSVAKHITERSGLDVGLIEKEYQFAVHQSGRNSGVLHPGFNYPSGSLKARFSTEGTRRMKDYCREHDVPVKEFGVVVVAQNERERSRLEALQLQATENGVETHFIESREELQEHEPHANGQAALYAPAAASIDSQQYVYALAREVNQRGVTSYLGHEVIDLTRRRDGYVVETDKSQFTCEYLVNAAGLYADRLAHKLDIGEEYQVIPFRGEYYELDPDSANLVKTMIYPTPDPELPFLGVHFTRRADQKVIVGPNAVPAFGREAYSNTQFDLQELSEMARYPGLWRLLASSKMIGVAIDELGKSYFKQRFVDAAAGLVPEVMAKDFSKSYAGIRAQLVSTDGELVKDPLFVEDDNGIHILNAVSPGLTSSLPFGDHIVTRLLDSE
jgi:L-2-hydroxyglutarate oxidase LhgO